MARHSAWPDRGQPHTGMMIAHGEKLLHREPQKVALGPGSRVGEEGPNNQSDLEHSEVVNLET